MSLFPPVMCWEFALGHGSYNSSPEEMGKKGRGNITLVKDGFSLVVQADCVAQMSVWQHSFGDVEN